MAARWAIDAIVRRPAEPTKNSKISLVGRRMGASPSFGNGLTSRELVDERQRLSIGGRHIAGDD